MFVIRILFRELFVLITVCAEARCELTEQILVASGLAEYYYLTVDANKLLAHRGSDYRANEGRRIKIVKLYVKIKWLFVSIGIFFFKISVLDCTCIIVCFATTYTRQPCGKPMRSEQRNE